jgi:hypothetical protein
LFRNLFIFTNNIFALCSILHWHYLCHHHLHIIITTHQFCSCFRTLG